VQYRLANARVGAVDAGGARCRRAGRPFMTGCGNNQQLLQRRGHSAMKKQGKPRKPAAVRREKAKLSYKGLSFTVTTRTRRLAIGVGLHA